MSRLKIMVIEDNSADVFILHRMLELEGVDFELEIAADGERALEFIQRQRENLHDQQPCVILLDLHLPKHSGLEVLSALRQSPVMGHIHVVVTTGLASPQEEADLRRLGARYRLKPMNLAQFRALAADLVAICQGIPIAA
jgi:chemotaxis family two-component system response regulator Rcp1